MSEERNEGGEPSLEAVADPGVGGPGGVARKAGPLRRLYDWVLHWAETRYGAPALGALSFAEASFFPIPPDPLLMALCLGAPKRSYRFAAICTGASVAGGIAGYAIGAGAWHVLADFFFQYVPGVTPEAFEGVRAVYDRWDFWAVFAAGLTPIPYKVFTLSAGVFAINFPVFVVASVISRSLRFFVVAALLRRFGEPMARFIDRHFNVLSVLFFILIALGFVVIEWVL